MTHHTSWKRLNSALLAAALVVALGSCGEQRTEEMRSEAQPKATTAVPSIVPASSDAQVEKELAAFKEGVATRCSRPWPKDLPPPAASATPPDPTKPVLVGMGSRCEKGYADPIINSIDPTNPAPPVTPIYAVDGSRRIVGYWGSDAGWIPKEAHDAPGFDIDAWNRAARHLFSPEG